MKRKKTNILVLSIYTLIILASFYVTNKSSSFTYLNSSNSLQIEGSQFTPNFESHEVFKAKKLSFHQTIIKKSDFPINNDKNQTFYSLYIIKLADNGIQVYFNDVLIGSRGDILNGHSNIWNDFTVMQIPTSLIKETNTLTFKTNSIYRSGLSAYPLYITNETVSPLFHNDLEILTNRFISITIGFILASIFVCLLLLLLNPADRKLFIYTALSSAFLLIYCYDYLSSDFIAFEYLNYKKLVMSGLFFGIAFYSYAISEYYKHNFLRWLGHITILGFMFIMSISSNMNTFKNLYTYFYIILLINVLYWIILSVIKYKQNKTIIFFTSFIILIVYAGSQVIIDILGKHSTINSPLIYISIIGILPLLLAYESYVEKDTAVDLESAKRKEAFINSVTDPLTGAWNQRYLYSLTDTNLVGSVVCVIDFDDFKKINDTYGHVAGDKVIVETCNIIKAKIRSIDQLIRYGGDEFVIILYNSTLEEAVERVSNIIKTVDTLPIDLNGNLLKITLSIGLYDVKVPLAIKEIIERADFQLYRAKSNGKNQISY